MENWREALDNSREAERRKAVSFVLKNYTREERYLKIFARDFSDFLNSAAWLQTQEARNFQKFYDFLACFASLREKMKEFRWSKELLLANGIDFAAAKKLYFSVA